MGISPRELLRLKDPLFKELGLIQRQIAEKGGKAVLCRPFDRVLEIL